jgi:hypothetical protein
MTCIET